MWTQDCENDLKRLLSLWECHVIHITPSFHFLLALTSGNHLSSTCHYGLQYFRYLILKEVYKFCNSSNGLLACHSILKVHPYSVWKDFLVFMIEQYPIAFKSHIVFIHSSFNKHLSALNSAVIFQKSELI